MTEAATQEWENSIGHIRRTIISGSEQIQNIAIQIVSGKVSSDSYTKLEDLSISNDQQITEAFTKYQAKVSDIEIGTSQVNSLFFLVKKPS